jgi:hypothetical protein
MTGGRTISVQKSDRTLSRVRTGICIYSGGLTAAGRAR